MTTQKNTVEVIQAEELLRHIEYLPLISGLDSWKEGRKALWEDELSKLPISAVEYAREMIKDRDKELKEMSIDRSACIQKTKINPELDARFYF